MPRSESPTTPQDPHREPTGCLGALVRLSWMVLGNGLLFLLALQIVRSRQFSVFDVLYFVAVAGLVILRYIDITRLGGTTSGCEPATLRDWRRYAVGLLVVAAIVWVSAHTVLIRFMS